jgi:3-hydroxypropanoate dehydrogenase
MGSITQFPLAAARRAQVGLREMLYPATARPAWSETPVPKARLDELHALMSLGPSMVDASPTRLLFLTSRTAKARLAPFIGEEYRVEVETAPLCGLIGYDLGFAAQIAEYLPHPPSAAWLEAPDAARQTALGNGVLQGAYLIVAARTLGLETSAIPDYDADGLTMEFFHTRRMRATFLCAIGYPAEPPAQA